MNHIALSFVMVAMLLGGAYRGSEEFGGVVFICIIAVIFGGAFSEEKSNNDE